MAIKPSTLGFVAAQALSSYSRSTQPQFEPTPDSAAAQEPLSHQHLPRHQPLQPLAMEPQREAGHSLTTSGSSMPWVLHQIEGLPSGPTPVHCVPQEYRWAYLIIASAGDHNAEVLQGHPSDPLHSLEEATMDAGPPAATSHPRNCSLLKMRRIC